MIGYGGRVYISFSDNKSFTILVQCYDDGVGSFVVTSPYKTLSPEAMTMAKEHLKALGFKEKNFLELNYDQDCDAPIEDVPTPKNLTTVPFYFSNLLLVPSPPRYTGLGNTYLFGIRKK